MERQSRLELDLGGEQIVLLRAAAEEAMSRHFVLSLELLSSLGEVDFAPHLGKPGVVTLYEDDELQRHFHGVVTDVRYNSHVEGAGWHYSLTLRPLAYLHEQGRAFRIYQNKSARDIIKATLDRCGITYQMKIDGASRVRLYCVQYGESDFDFAHRLMEEEGLYFYYQHSDADHTMVICDSTGAHQPLAHATLTYNPISSDVFNVGSGARGSGGRHFVSTWNEQLSTGSEGLVTLRDYNFIDSNKVVEASNEESHKHAGTAIEVFDYPGRFYDNTVGNDFAKFILEARQATRVRWTGLSEDHGLQVGHTFTMKGHPIDRFNSRYLIVSTAHEVAEENYRSTLGGEPGSRVSLMAIPADTQFRALPETPRPHVSGPETARVTGPDNEEIHVDKYGRVKVKFHWDREGRDDDTSSCWVRVSQTGGLGNIIIPRVGHEVLIDFINGDPDRPIVVGRVFNDQNMPVYPLPDHKTRALWRTKRYGQAGSYGSAKSLDTGSPGANELRFEDKGGEEEVFLHAERDLNTRVRYIETHHVGLDQKLNIGQNRDEEVGSDETVKINNDRTHEVGSNDKLKVGQKLTIEAGSEIEMKAGSKITINVGGSTITLEPGSIKIDTPDLKMSGTAQAKLSSALTTVEASAVLTAKGTLVKIN